MTDKETMHACWAILGRVHDAAATANVNKETLEQLEEVATALFQPSLSKSMTLKNGPNMVGEAIYKMARQTDKYLEMLKKHNKEKYNGNQSYNPE